MVNACELPQTPATEDRRLPVTLLSGFLGSGKTTLLSNILKSKDHGLRCALIVNDMGALNIDAALVKNHKLTQKGEKIIQMQNGCICCTLRADLLEEIANLAEMDAFDYLLIESSGISEPIQVAETFTTEFADTVAESTVEEILEGLPSDATAEANEASRRRLAQLIKDGGLSKVARLDTCVSVVDCTTFMGDFDTTDFLTDRLGEEVDPQDERNITDLLVDQIEFANVVLLNKTDAVTKDVVDKVEGIVKTLNPDAKIFRTSYSKVPLKELLNTQTFDFAKAATGAGWLQSLREVGEWTDSKGVTKKIPKPETEEYGISSFVYAARRPFHPQRLWELMKEPFCILQNSEGDDHGDEDEWQDEEGGSSVDEASASADVDGDINMSDAADETEEEEKEETKAEILARLQAEKEALDLPARIAFKRASPVWSGVLRSKGFAWLATRPTVSGEWSQAGCMWTLNGGSPWMCAVDESMWPTDDPEVVQAIKTDFMGPWGDRRQEIVFIGQNIPQDKLEETLNGALLTDKEWKDWEKIMNSNAPEEKKIEKLYNKFDDGWEEWSNPLAEIEVEITDDEAEAEAEEVETTSSVREKASAKENEKAAGNGHAGHKHAHRIDKNGKVHHDHAGGAIKPAKRVKV